MKIFKILSVFCFTLFSICGCAKKTSGDELLGEIKKKGESEEFEAWDDF